MPQTLFKQGFLCYNIKYVLRAISSVGQSWRLITAWSRVQVLDGPPKKECPLYGGTFFIQEAIQDLNSPCAAQAGHPTVQWTVG